MKKSNVILALTMFLVLSSFAAAFSLQDVGSFFGISVNTGNAATTGVSIYDRYAGLFDFLIFTTLFVAIAHIAFSKVFGDDFKKAGAGVFYYIKEFRVEDLGGYELGQEVNVNLFKPGDVVDVTSLSKGKGFAGVMKRHGFHGSPGSHGTHEYFRHGGSVGSAAFPHHTFKGMKMPGQHGNRKVTLQNIKVIDIKEDQNLLLLKGGIPGSPTGWVLIRSATKSESTRTERKGSAAPSV